MANRKLEQSELQNYLDNLSSQEMFDEGDLQEEGLVVEELSTLNKIDNSNDEWPNYSERESPPKEPENDDSMFTISENSTSTSECGIVGNLRKRKLPPKRFTFAAQIPRSRRIRLKKTQLLRTSTKGRKQAIVWEQFVTTKDERTGEIISNKCKVCLQNVSAQACRMEKHLTKCNQKPQAKKADLIHSTEPVVSPVSLKASQIVFPEQAEVKSKMKNWVDSIEFKEKEVLDIKVARFIFGSNLSFRTVGNPLFKELFNHLKPSYKLPSPEVIGSTLLENVYTQTNKTIKEELQGKKLTILQDGWSTKQNMPVIAHCLHDGIKSYYLDAIETKTESKTADYCMELLENAIEKTQRLFDCTIIGVGTDNTESMNSLRRKCQKKYPNINVYGCQSHVFNLLGQDITPKDLIDKVTTVQKFFRNHHFESAALKQLGGLRPVLSNATRWNSQLDCLRNFTKNQTKYLEVSRMPNSKLSADPSVLATLNDNSIYDRISQTLKILEPIAVALDECQSETASISVAVHHWLKIEKVFPQHKMDIFRGRRQMGMTPASIAAYMLHPLFRGEGLCKEDIELGTKHIERASPFFAAAAVYLRLSDETFYPKALLNKEIKCHLTPSLWWRNLQNYGSITPSLINFAEDLMLLPASTSSLERCFSTMKDILTNKRNRLDIVKTQKLCSIYRTLSSQYDLPNEEAVEEAISV